jgi:hypothetical protein
MAGGQDQAIVSMYLNATLPTGAAGVPAAWTALNASAMKLRLDSTAATASAAGTQLTGTGYTPGGTAMGQSTASSSGSAVTIPVGATSWTNGSGGAWSIVSLDVTDGAGTPVRTWWGPFNGQPISVANGNVFQVAANAISVSDT